MQRKYNAMAMGSDGKAYVCGPQMPGHDGGTLYPHMRFNELTSALAAADCCDLAYRAGYEAAQQHILDALGIGHFSPVSKSGSY